MATEPGAQFGESLGFSKRDQQDMERAAARGALEDSNNPKVHLHDAITSTNDLLVNITSHYDKEAEKIPVWGGAWLLSRELDHIEPAVASFHPTWQRAMRAASQASPTEAVEHFRQAHQHLLDFADAVSQGPLIGPSGSARIHPVMKLISNHVRQHEGHLNAYVDAVSPRRDS